MGTSAMAKKKGRPRTDRKERVVRIDADLAVMVQRVADYRGVVFSEAHSEITRAAIKRAYGKMLDDLDTTKGEQSP